MSCRRAGSSEADPGFRCLAEFPRVFFLMRFSALYIRNMGSFAVSAAPLWCRRAKPCPPAPQNSDYSTDVGFSKYSVAKGSYRKPKARETGILSSCSARIIAATPMDLGEAKKPVQELHAGMCVFHTQLVYAVVWGETKAVNFKLVVHLFKTAFRNTK